MDKPENIKLIVKPFDLFTNSHGTTSGQFAERWSEEDKRIWKETDWDGLCLSGKQEVVVENDTYVGFGYFYDGEKLEMIQMTFVKKIHFSRALPPTYEPVYTPALKEYIKEHHYVKPHHSNTEHNGYYVMNHFETQEIYDELSK